MWRVEVTIRGIESGNEATLCYARATTALDAAACAARALADSEIDNEGPFAVETLAVTITKQEDES